MRGAIRWASVAAICVFAVTVQAQSTTWHDDSFTDSTGRTLLYRLWVRSDWDLSRPRGINLILHGNNRGTAEDARQGKWGVTEEALDLGLAVVVPGSPFSSPEDLTFGERTLVGPSIGSEGTRFWSSHDARLIHELLQSRLDGRLAIDYDKVVFTGASQGTCFLADFVEFYGGSYGGGFHAWCGCFWLDFDGDDSHDTFAIAPPFHAAPWRPTFQWTPAATDAVRDRFSVFVEATTEDFLHPAAVSMSRYYSEWLGLRTATDLNTPGGHCHQGATPRSEIYNWLLSGAGPELPGSQGDTDGDGTPDSSDLDDDNDGAPDFIDAVPRDRQDWRDTDGDGIADARDRDADGDGVGNALDPFPLDSSEQLDTDGDGIGNRVDGDDDNDGLPDARDPQPLVGTDDGRSLAFVRFAGGGPISNYNGFHTSARATVHAARPADVVYPAAQGDVQHYQFLELGDSLDRRFEIMVDQFVRPESCRDVLLSPLCDVGRFSASGYYTTYFHNRFDRIWIDRNRNRDLTDDGPPLLVALSEDNWGARTTVAILEVPYVAGQVLPYAVSFTSNRLPDGLGYGGESVWKGKVVAPSGERVSVIVVDGNVDGLFDSDGDFVCLDFDRNGWLNECDFSEDADGNRVRTGALTPPFEWDGGRQRLSVAPSGHSVAWLTAVANRPPVPVGGALPGRVLAPDSTVHMDVSLAFSDPDGDALTYRASSTAPQVIMVSTAGARVTLTSVSEGTATVQVTATDPGGLSAMQSFTVEVTTAEPPFSGTVFITPDILTTADPSGLTGIAYNGRGDRTIWDYRVLDWIKVNTYLFEARIHGRRIEFQVNPEFGSVDAARAEVDTYALALGRLPAVLLSRAEKVHVNAGDPGHPDAAKRGRVTKVFGGNYFDRSFTIHTGYGQRILRDGFLEEALFHEGAHVSLQNHQDAPGWRAAQEADGEYISDYARDFPDREDMAESLLPYFAIRYRPDRLSADHRAAIEDAISNRLEYFDGLALDWSPYTSAVSTSNQPSENQIYYFPHLAVGAGWQTTLTYINYSPEEVTCETEFLSGQGTPLMVSFPSLGPDIRRTDVLPPGGSVHEETDVGLRAALAAGWARATCSGPVKASLLFRQYDSAGTPVAEAGVNAAAAPATRFVTFAERSPGELGTGVAYANPSDTSVVVTFTALDETGRMLPSVKQTLMPNGHGAQNMAGLFPRSSFTGSLEITSTGPIVSLSLNAEAAPVFSSLPPGEPDASKQGPTTYYFPHLAVGASWQTTLTYINYSLQKVTCETEFISDHGGPLLVSFPGRGMVDSRVDILPPGGSVHEETDVGLSAPLVSGWARADCTGPVKASLLFRQYDSAGVPTGEAGVNAAAAPATRFVTFAEKRAGQPGTAVAYANPSDTSTAVVTFTAKDAAGRTLDSIDQTLMPRGHGAQNMAVLFSLTSFTGSLEITSTEPIVTLSLNAEASPVFSSLPPGEVDAAEIPD